MPTWEKFDKKSVTYDTVNKMVTNTCWKVQAATRDENVRAFPSDTDEEFVKKLDIRKLVKWLNSITSLAQRLGILTRLLPVLIVAGSMLTRHDGHFRLQFDDSEFNAEFGRKFGNEFERLLNWAYVFSSPSNSDPFLCM